MKKKSKITVEIPVETEVLDLNEDLFKKAVLEKDKGVVIYLDARERDWFTSLGLPKGSRVRFVRPTTVDIKELSSFMCPITYRVTIAEAYWLDGKGNRHDFGLGEHLGGIDLKRGVTTVTLRAAVLLAVLACVGLRSVVWLMKELFHVELSKSALNRWIGEAAAHLPDAEGMAKRLMADKPVTEAHMDEIFPKGWKKGCVMVVKDEHGRILATEEVEERTKVNVVAFLERLKSWGLSFRAFYVDGCKAYKEAIPVVFPEAAIQYDYFHIIQNIFRHLWRATVSHRKAIKAEAKETNDGELRLWLEKLAKRLWTNRGLLFKNDERMTVEERRTLRKLMGDDLDVNTLRLFISKVWGIFRDSKGERGARQRLAKLKARPEVEEDNAFGKVVKFLDSRFEDMTAFLRSDGVKRNSLAESGIRCLRRLERGHDGFRGTTGRDNYLRLYQAIRYCGWSVHRGDGSLELPSSTEA